MKRKKLDKRLREVILQLHDERRLCLPKGPKGDPGQKGDPGRAGFDFVERCRWCDAEIVWSLEMQVWVHNRAGARIGPRACELLGRSDQHQAQARTVGRREQEITTAMPRPR